MLLIGAALAWVVGKVTSKAFFLSIQIVVSLALMTAHIVTLGFFIYAITFIFNKYNELLDLIASYSSQSEILGLAMNVLQALGVMNAFNDVFALFSPFLLTFLGYRASLIVFKAYEHTSNEVFKVGVLVQQ